MQPERRDIIVQNSGLNSHFSLVTSLSPATKMQTAYTLVYKKKKPTKKQKYYSIIPTQPVHQCWVAQKQKQNVIYRWLAFLYKSEHEPNKETITSPSVLMLAKI